MGYISKKDLELLDGYFRASNYLSVAQLYLMDNPLLFEPLKLNHLKPHPVGHFGTTPGQNFIYTHLNRIIKKNNKVVVSGINMVTKHIKPSAMNETGGRVEMEAPIHISNVKVITDNKKTTKKEDKKEEKKAPKKTTKKSTKKASGDK